MSATNHKQDKQDKEAGPGTGQVPGFGPVGSRPTARRAVWALLAAMVVGLVATGCGSDSSDAASDTARQLDPARYSPTVDHPFVPWAKVRLTVFKGREGELETGVVQRVLERRKKVSGVPVTVVSVTETENGEIVERTQDYYAERNDGAAMYMGEAVSDYKDGKLISHEGQWLAGKDGAKPGVFMPADPKVGQAFEQERAPGIAEDRSTVVKTGVKITVPAGSFKGCIKTKDVAPLDNNKTEFKYYCPDVGLVREEAPRTQLDLVRYR